MPGPWEKYQEPSGPWDKYQDPVAPEKPESGFFEPITGSQRTAALPPEVQELPELVIDLLLNVIRPPPPPPPPLPAAK